jgi:hypothetical protein
VICYFLFQYPVYLSYAICTDAFLTTGVAR